MEPAADKGKVAEVISDFTIDTEKNCEISGMLAGWDDQ